MKEFGRPNSAVATTMWSLSVWTTHISTTTMRVCVCACVCHVRLGAVAAVSLFWIILDYRMAAQL